MVAATAKSCRKVKVSHAAVKSFDRRGVSCKNARTVQFSGGVEKSPVTQNIALPLALCSTHEPQLNWTHGHRWSCVRCEEHRAWPTTTSIVAAGNQSCSPVGAGCWGTRRRVVLTVVSKNCQPEGDTLSQCSSLSNGDTWSRSWSCVQWDVKPYYIIPFFASIDQVCEW